jgi:hypothetical protein
MQYTKTLYGAMILVAALAAATGCSQRPTPGAAHAQAFAWPPSLAPFGDGYPNSGDACRRLGESAATSPYLDHMSRLVGCPGAADGASAQALVRDRRGRVLGVREGVTLISIPTQEP